MSQTKVRGHPLFPGQPFGISNLTAKAPVYCESDPFPIPGRKSQNAQKEDFFQPEAQLIAMARLQAVAFDNKKRSVLEAHLEPSALGTQTSLFLIFVFQCYLFHSCIQNLRKYSYSDHDWLCMACYFSRIYYNKLLEKKVKLLLILSYVLGKQWFINKHRITFSEFKVTKKPWYKFAAGQGMSLQLTNERSLVF